MLIVKKTKQDHMKPLSLSKPPPSPLDPNPFANCEQSAPADGLARSNG